MNNPHKSMIHEWRFLKEICTPELYFNNVFRITGLGITTTIRSANKYNKEILQREKLGLSIQFPQSPIYHLPYPPSVEKIRFSIEQKFFNPQRRILEELFWFWPLNWGTENQNDLALSLINSGKIDEAVMIWRSCLSARPESVVANHNLAVYSHMRVLDLEHKLQGNAENQGIFNQNHYNELLLDLSKTWKFALKNWYDIWIMDDFWYAYSYRIHEIDTAIGRDKILLIRHQLPSALLSINARLSIQYGIAGDLAGSKFHLSSILDSDFDEEHKLKAINEAIESLVNQIHRYNDVTKNKFNTSPEDGLHAGLELLNKSRQAVKFIIFLSSFQKFSMLGRSARDGLAETVLDAFIAYGNKTANWQPLLEPLSELDVIAGSDALKRRINENYNTIELNAQAQELEKELEVIGEICDNISKENDPETQYLGVIQVVKPKLEDLKNRKGALSEVYKQASNLCAVCIRGISVDLHNKSSNDELAFKAIAEAINIAEDPSLISKLQTDKITVEEYLLIKNNREKNILIQKKRVRRNRITIAAIIVGVAIIWVIGSIMTTNKKDSTNSSSLKKRPPINRSSSLNYKSKDNLGEEIEQARNAIKILETQITNVDTRLEGYKTLMDSYNRLGQTDKYNDLVSTYNDLVNNRNSIYYKYERLLSETNNKIDQYNRRR